MSKRILNEKQAARIRFEKEISRAEDGLRMAIRVVEQHYPNHRCLEDLRVLRATVDLYDGETLLED